MTKIIEHIVSVCRILREQTTHKKMSKEGNLCFEDYCFLKTLLIISEYLIGSHICNYSAKDD